MNVQKQIESLLAAGRVVLVESWPTVCIYTDAILGEASRVYGDYATRAEADADSALYVHDGVARLNTFEPTPVVEVAPFNLF